MSTARDELLARCVAWFAEHGVGDTSLRTLATGLVGAVLMIAQQWVLSENPQAIESVIGSAHTILSAVLGQLGPQPM